MHRENMNAYTILVGNPEGLLRRTRPRWEYDIKMGLREIAYGGINWIDLAQDGASEGLF
jgi:hypothetical protein